MYMVRPRLSPLHYMCVLHATWRYVFSNNGSPSRSNDCRIHCFDCRSIASVVASTIVKIMLVAYMNTYTIVGSTIIEFTIVAMTRVASMNTYTIVASTIVEFTSVASPIVEPCS